MSDRLSTTLQFESVQEENNNYEEQQKRQKMRRRYVERLGENPTIDMQRVMPGNSLAWDEIGTLRREVYVDEHAYLTPESLDENGREYDEYDEKSGTVHICATSAAGEVVGYVRILTKGEEGEDLLPAEKAFHTELSKNTIEISRLISKRGFPGAPLVTLALIRAALHEVSSDPEKYGDAIATIEPFLALHLDNMGIPIEVLREEQETPEYNSSNMLVKMDHTKIVERATAMDAERKFSPVYPEKLGPWFDEMKAERGLGRIALVHENGDK